MIAPLRRGSVIHFCMLCLSHTGLQLMVSEHIGNTYLLQFVTIVTTFGLLALALLGR